MTQTIMPPSTVEVERPKKPAAGKRPAARALPRVFEGAVTGLRAHDLVTRGVTVADARNLMKTFTLIGEAQLYGVLGITPRTMQRRAASAHKTLDPNASDRALRLLSVTGQAIDVLGSQDAAERWLSAPAPGLDRRKPIDLLQSSEGTELVKTLLTRMDFGVYA
ncbi:MAG: type II RES/Xre toxin-antitoxin system antitoxin [Pseudomonadota bacterium]